MAMPIRLELLGTFKLSIGKTNLSKLETVQTAELLALLALSPGRCFSREELAERLWEEGAVSARRHRLTQALSVLRRLFEEHGMEEALTSDRASVTLKSQSIQTDVQEFRYLVDLAKREPRPLRKIELLRTAIGIYRGDLLSGHHSEWVEEVRWGLASDYLLALRELALAYEEANDFDGAIDCYARVVSVDTLDESAHCDLMEAMLHAGRVTSVLRQFSQLEQLLKEELRLVPGERAQALLRKAKKLSSIDRPRLRKIPEAVPETEVAARVPSRLPASLTRFFGREEDIQQVLWLLKGGERRLMTLTGPGGTGKTRLSIEVGRRAEAELGARFVFASLANAEDEGTALDAILGAFHLSRSPRTGQREQLIEALQHDPATWLILDNFDRVVSLAAAIVSPLLERVPSLRVVATSRRRLNLTEELEIPLRPLPVPGEAVSLDDLYRYPSVQLFVDRAQSASRDFRIHPQNVREVIELCRGLEGVPLAVELAAAWTSVLSPAQMIEQLQDRFSLLVSQQTNREDRHKTLWATIEYSYHLLTPELRRAFRRVAVFRGGWTTEAFRDVCEDPEPALTMAQLYERSLILVEEEQLGGVPKMRYRMLDSLREFAWGQLGEEEQQALAAPHAAYFARLAEESQAQLVSHDQEVWLARLGMDLGNFLQALEWCLARHQARLGLQIGAALALFWEFRGYFAEGKTWLRRLLSLGSDEDVRALRAKTLIGYGRLAWYQSRYNEAFEAHQEALEFYRDLNQDEGVAEALYNLGITTLRQSRFEESERYIRESLRLATTGQDRLGMSRAFLNLGNLALEAGEPQQALEHYEESRSLARQIGNKERELYALNNLVNVARELGLLELSAAYLDECLRLDRQLGSQLPHTLTAMNLASVCLSQGDDEGAFEHASQGLRAHQENQSWFSMQSSLLTLCQIAVRHKQYMSACKLIGGIIALSDQIGYPLPPTLRRSFDALGVEIRDLISEEEFEAWVAGGKVMDSVEIVDFATEWSHLCGLETDDRPRSYPSSNPL